MNSTNWNQGPQAQTLTTLGTQGIKPPQNQFTGTTGNWTPKENTDYRINSTRVPFAVQYFANKYGGLQSKMGTNLGR